MRDSFWCILSKLVGFLDREQKSEIGLWKWMVRFLIVQQQAIWGEAALKPVELATFHQNNRIDLRTSTPRIFWFPSLVNVVRRIWPVAAIESGEKKKGGYFMILNQINPPESRVSDGSGRLSWYVILKVVDWVRGSNAAGRYVYRWTDIWLMALRIFDF